MDVNCELITVFRHELVFKFHFFIFYFINVTKSTGNVVVKC